MTHFVWKLNNTPGLVWLALILDAYNGWTYHRDWPWYFWWALWMGFRNRHPWSPRFPSRAK